MNVAAVLAVLLSSAAWGSPIGPVARTVIPAGTHQIISVDYVTVKKFDAAMALKAQVLPDNLKEFENVLKGSGVNPDTDVESFTFVSFDNGKEGSTTIGVASGSFSSKKVLTAMQLQNAKPTKYHSADMYLISKTMAMTFLNDNTIMLGRDSALRVALDVRDGHSSNLDSNPDLTKLVKSVQKSPVWSVQDQKGSQNMLVSVLGDKSKLPEFDNIKKQVLGSRFLMGFSRGFNFYIDVLTADDIASAKLAALLKAGVLYKKVTGTPAQQAALENVTVTSEPINPTSDRSHLKMQFTVNQEQFLKLLHSNCFAAVSNERKELSGVTSEEVTEGPKPQEQSSTRPQ